MKAKLVTHPLFHSPIEIKSALNGIASQEGHDGPDDDLMVEAARYIAVLERRIESLEDHMKDIDPEFVKIVEDNFRIYYMDK